MANQNSHPLTLTYINLRKIVGLLAMSLPLVIFLGEKVLLDVDLQPSISAFYYTPMRWYFVLTLCGIGFFLLFYQGYDDLDKWLARIAGVAAFSTAFFPTSNPNSDLCASPLLSFNSAVEPLSKTYISLCTATERVHLISAAIMFLTVAFFSTFRFTKGEDKTKEKKRRDLVYRVCGIVIFVSIPVMGLSFLWEDFFAYTVYAGEFVALVAFGISWMVKGEWLWMRDAAPLRNSQTFNKLQSRQVNGYKSGMGVFVFLIAIWFTTLLYSAEVAPFNLFAGDTSGEAEQAASVVTTTLDSEGDEGVDGEIKTPKIQVLNPEVLSALCYPVNTPEADEEKNESSCKHYNETTGRVEVGLIITNVSGEPVDVKFGALLGQLCEAESKCIFVNQAAIDPPDLSESVQVPGNAYKTFMISFPKEELAGQIILVGGNTISKIPFNVAEEIKGDEVLPPAGETPRLGFYKTESQTILLGILFVLVVVVIYFILNNQVLSLFWPLVRRNFRVDMGQDKDKVSEAEELWTLFSNQVNELGLSPRFSVNPRSETGVAAPSTLTPDNSYLKTFFDLVNWIFPRLGYSLRLNKMSSKTLGAGLSLAVVKNNQKETVAEKTLWASIYRLEKMETAGQGKEAEGKEADQEADLSVYRLLMIPAYFWFADVVDRLDGFDPNPRIWESQAYNHLGNASWHSDLDKGLNFFTNSINMDQTNWPAYAALGRVWTEKSQESKEITEEIAKEYLLLANSYLDTAIHGLRKGNIDQVYFGALYNKIVALFYLSDLEHYSAEKKQELLRMGYAYKEETLAAFLLLQDILIERKPERTIQYDALLEVSGTSARGREQAEIVVSCSEICNRIKEKLDSPESQTQRDVGETGIQSDAASAEGGQAKKAPGKNKNNDKKISCEELKCHALGGWLVDFLPALEFVLLLLELNTIKFVRKEKHNPSAKEYEVETWLEAAVNRFADLPCCQEPVDMDRPLLPPEKVQKSRRHFTRSHYRVQFNAACFYSRLALKTKAEGFKNDDYMNLALDHLEMALGVGGGLVYFAQKDSALNAIRDEPRYKTIIKGESISQNALKRMSANRSVYRRKEDGKWVNKRDDAKRATSLHDTQEEAIKAAREMLHKQGGGELSIHGEDGKIRDKDTIAPGNDPREIKG